MYTLFYGSRFLLAVAETGVRKCCLLDGGDARLQTLLKDFLVQFAGCTCLTPAILWIRTPVHGYQRHRDVHAQTKLSQWCLPDCRLPKLLTADHVAALQEDDFCATLLRKWIAPTTCQRCSSSPSRTVALLWKTVCLLHSKEWGHYNMDVCMRGTSNSLSAECLRRVRVQNFCNPLTTSEGTGYCIRCTSRTRLHSSVPHCMLSKNGEWAADAQDSQTRLTLT